jgi:hypothetical protein
MNDDDDISRTQIVVVVVVLLRVGDSGLRRNRLVGVVERLVLGKRGAGALVEGRCLVAAGIVDEHVGSTILILGLVGVWYEQEGCSDRDSFVHGLVLGGLLVLVSQ